MKKILLMALAAAFITACSENEPMPEVNNGPSEQFNILTSVVGSRATETPDGVIKGQSMPAGSVIGVQVTQGSGESVAAYAGMQPTASGAAEHYENGTNIYFKEGSGTWASYDPTSSTTAKKLYIGSEVGTVYAYYPYTTTVTNLGESATVPATVLTTGDIAPGTPTGGTAYYTAGEVDYLYYKPASDRATVSSTSKATATLTMHHAMASVSFRMYVSKNAPTIDKGSKGDENYYLMGYTIQNAQNKSVFKAASEQSGYTMNIATGAITATAGGALARTINKDVTPTSGYALTRSTEESGTASDSELSGLPWFSNLVIPLDKITQGDIEVAFSIRKGSSTTDNNPISYVVPLTVKESTGDSGANKDGSDMWLAGNNYQYTVKVNAFDELNITDVTVTKWVDVVGGDMEIQ